MRRDQELVSLFLSGYNRLTGCAFEVTEWPDEVERTNPAVEAVASDPQGRRMAIEHTLTQPFVGERDDTQAFRTVFLQLETNPSFRVPGDDIEVWPPVGAIPKGTDWQRMGTAVGKWFLRSARLFPEGDSVQSIGEVGLDLCVPVRKARHPEGAVFVGRSGVPDTFEQVLEHALRRKLPKLSATSADVRVLLLEKASLPRGYAEVTRHVDRLRPSFPELSTIGEIWIVNTLEWEKSGSLWFLKVWPNGVGARFTLREKPGELDSVIYVRGSGETALWHEFCS